MTALDAAAKTAKRAPILRGYFDPRSSLRWRLLRLSIVGLLCCFCFVYGAFFALIGQYLPALFIIPFVILSSVIVWALPETGTAPTRFMVGAFWAFLVSLIAWPNYLAIALPGMPWITLIRLSGFPMALALLISVSMSEPFRRTCAQTLAATPLIWKLLATFIVFQIISLPFSNALADSLQKFVLYQVEWTAIFFVSAYVFTKPGRATHWAIAIWLLAIVVSLIAAWEYKKGALPWAGHIPSFLKVENPDVARILQGQHRIESGYDLYRVQSTFSTSLGLAEYIALAVPFTVHFVVSKYPIALRLAAAASIPFFAFIIIATDSKIGSVGSLVTIVLYPLIWALLRWKHMRSSLLARAVVWAYPMFFVATIGASFFVHRLHNLIWGGADHAGSTEARVEQYRRGIPLLFSHPLGYGVGRGAEALGDYNELGVLTIDTYYMMIALDYGVFGFLAYYGMLMMGMFYTGKTLYHAPNDKKDYDILVPLFVAQAAFFVIKSVFSNQDNHPLIFMMLGMAAALAFRVRNDLSANKAIAPTP